MSRFRNILPLLLSAAFTTPAAAQQTQAPLPDPESIGDAWTIALGVGMTPDYVGSDDYRLIPAAAVRGKIGSIGISTRSTYVYADLVHDSSPRFGIAAGPIVGVRLNRTGDIKDDLVDLLPERKTALEIGGFAGVSFKQLTNPYDSLNVGIDVVHDVLSATSRTPRSCRSAAAPTNGCSRRASPTPSDA